jgi:RsiW-degrading membrane proteinase PrsW (M82 family)
LLYKLSWQFFPWLNAFKIADLYKEDVIGFSNFAILPLSVVITFMLVGLIEETMKLFAVKAVDDEDFRSVDDSMEFFIIAALGFSFTENVLYFYNIWLSQGPVDLFIPFLFRSSFSTFAHILFSGILGYYYGVAHFAKPILQDEIRANRKHWTVILHKIFNFRKEKMFYEEKIFEGLLISIGLHAIFNIFLEMNLSFMMLPYLVCGQIALNYLFAKKENNKEFGKVLVGVRNHPHPQTKVYFERQAIRNNN